MLKNINKSEKDYILESKKLCKDLGMNPNILNIPKNIMSKSELDKKRKYYEEILEVVNFFGKKIIRSLEGIPILIGISDEKGYILDIYGDESIKDTATKLGVVPGNQYLEEDVGTNVVSLTLKQNHPVQLIGKDHYHVHFHDIACYGVPFSYSDNKKLLGTICIMTGVILHNPFFLMTLSTVVDAIERELLLRRQNREISRQKELLYNAEKRQREMLEKDLAMKDEFITLITHEFKTPINVIYSAVQLIEYLYINKIPNKVVKLVESIKRNTYRQLRLVNNFLDITKLNSNQFKLNFKNIDTVLLTKIIIESVNIYANEKKINLYFKPEIDNLNILIDDEKYERIILNLLSNAIKFTPDNGEITVKIRKHKDNMLAVDVIDNGIGIPEEKYDTIFQRFGQVENSLSRRAEGSGIGLALVKTLTFILGGKIEVKSKVGVGSTFTIYIPIKQCVDNEKVETFLNNDNRIMNAINVEFSDIYF